MTPSPYRSHFARLWTASTASGVATWALAFILGLGVAHGAWSATLTGWLLGSRTVGFLLGVSIGGVLGDRWSRRSVVLVAGLLAAAATVALAVLLPQAVLASSVAAALVGVGQGACRPAFQAMVRDQVPLEGRQSANAAMSLSVRVAVLLGPSLAAAASRMMPDRQLVVATAGLWALTAVLPARSGPEPVHSLPCDSAQNKPGSSGSGPFSVLVGDLREGVEEARRHRWFVAGLGALTTVVALGYSATSIALPLVSREQFGGDGALAGAVTGYAGGALVGALVIARWRPSSLGWWALLGLGAYALVPLALALSSSVWPIVVVYVLAGFGIELFNVPWFTAVQREVPADKVARVSSLDFLCSYGLSPLGLAFLAPAIVFFGARPVLLSCAGACALACALAAMPGPSRTFTTEHSESSTC